ncbi:AraC family transcriptional regulator [Brenneria izadpanahii]|uniref:AraC family transcriptional regulator n=1 Tax=Brenneria izadpanahii TaxID=2722756 RepID=A0ABX7UWR4_9GAMM|nr:AraC family transcriptional regulator [Brenneria izadpanahii]QTF09840.1 AraC family transcriptional regulator [Brenneria izadpanahii]
MRSYAIQPEGVVEATVLATMMEGLERFIEQQGADAAGVLARAGLKSELLKKPNQPISFGRYCQAVNEAAKQTGNENFGLMFGAQFLPQQLGLLGYLCLSSRTLGQALTNLARYFPLHQQNSELRLSQQPDGYRLEYRVDDAVVIDRRQNAELSMMIFLNIMRHVLGNDWSPAKVYFEHKAPRAKRAHLQLFGCVVYFQKPQNAIFFSREVMNRPMPECNDYLFNVVRHSLEIVGEQNQSAVNLVSEVKSELITLLATGNPRLDTIAKRLKMPSWTLQRRLAEYGVSFKDMIESTRRELAVYYLEQRQVSISELSALLGYAEVSVLSRAFHRWYGASPKKWRSSIAG